MYKSILGYPNYIISEDGDVKNIETGRTLKWDVNKDGYLKVSLYKDGKRKILAVHRLIYKTFVAEIPPGFVIDHIDCNRANNALSNLRLVTRMQNGWNTKNTKGCSFKKDIGKWHAQICFNGKNKYLGHFNTEEEAHAAYLNAKKIYHIID